MSGTRESVLDEIFGPSKAARDRLRSEGVDAGFKIAQREIAKLLRREGYTEMASRVERLTLRKRQ